MEPALKVLWPACRLSDSSGFFLWFYMLHKICTNLNSYINLCTYNFSIISLSTWRHLVKILSFIEPHTCCRNRTITQCNWWLVHWHRCFDTDSLKKPFYRIFGFTSYSPLSLSPYYTRLKQQTSQNKQHPAFFSEQYLQFLPLHHRLHWNSFEILKDLCLSCFWLTIDCRTQ